MSPVVKLWVFVAVTLLGGLVATIMIASRGDEGEIPETAPVAVTQPAAVAAYGRLEPRGGIRDIAGPAGERVLQVLVNVGQRVDDGQVVAEMESAPLRQAELAALDAQIAVTERSAEDVQRASELKKQQAEIATERTDEPTKLAIEAARLQLKMATTAAEDARSMLERMQSLSRKPSARQIEVQEQLVAKAETEEEAARIAFKTAELSASSGRREAGIASESVAVESDADQRALGLEVLKAKREVARVAYERSLVRSPLTGEVVDVVTQSGEAPNGRPIVRVARTANMVVIAEVFEGDRSRIDVGDTARIFSDALPVDLTGQVEQIGRIVGPNAVRSLNPMAPSDRRIVEVTIAIDPTEGSEIADDLLGLQVDVIIKCDSAAPVADVEQPIVPELTRDDMPPAELLEPAPATPGEIAIDATETDGEAGDVIDDESLREAPEAGGDS